MQFKLPRSYSSALKQLKTTAPILCENWVCIAQSSLYAMLQRLVLSTSIFGKSKQPPDTQEIITPQLDAITRILHILGVELTNEQWIWARPLISSTNRNPCGRRCARGNSGDLSNGVLWLLRIGAPLKDMPPRYSSYQTCHRRLQPWVQQFRCTIILQRYF